MTAMVRRPSLAVWKFASCDGCQLTVLDGERELLELAEAVDIAHFPEASSASAPGPYDVSLVEGSISTADDVERLRRIRAISTTLVAIGACATSGGIQALRNAAGAGDLAGRVYPSPDLLARLERSTPLSDHVRVDLELTGCPIDRGQLVGVLSALLSGRRPDLPTEAVCLECRRRGIVCVLVTGRGDCLGGVTRTGCGALCPSIGRPCFGCFGPKEEPNFAALSKGRDVHDAWIRR